MLYGQRSRYVEAVPIRPVNEVKMKMAAGTPTGGECQRPLRRGAALVRLILETLVFVVLLPLGAFAQSSFAGVVRDDSGAVLPGVTVEAASPALIEKVRTATTDGEGRYRVADLRPGVYNLTFDLAGFSPVVRANLELAADIVVTINADMKVGSLEEAVTVTGQTPVVDVQQASRTQVLQRTVIDALPTARTFNSIAALAPALVATNPDVGGSLMTNPVQMKGHGIGSSQNSYVVDGFLVNLFVNNATPYFNEAVGAEVSLTTSAIPAETAAGGFRQSIVMRDGGNTFSASGYAGGTAGTWIAAAVSDDMRRRGVQSGNTVEHIELFNGTVGGPVVRDRLWFLTGVRHASSTFRPANFPREVVLPTGDHLVTDTQDHVHDVTARLTWQAVQSLKVAGYFQRIFKQYAFAAAGQDPAANWKRDPAHGHEGVGSVKLSWIPTSRFLVEGGFGTSIQFVRADPVVDYLNVAPFAPQWYALARRTDTALNFSPLCTLPTGCTAWGGVSLVSQETIGREVKVSASYVTGTHNLKVGITDRFGISGTKENSTANLIQNYVAGRPSSVTVGNYPVNNTNAIRYDLGLFVQDSWTIKRLTLSPGVRIQWLAPFMRPSYAELGRFVPARAYPELNVPGWGPDVAPRFAVAYDLFGDGKTALKGSVSKYYLESTGYANLYSPAGTQTDTRNWFDCDLMPGTSTCSNRNLPTNSDDIAQDNEIGPSSNPVFGLAPARARDPNNKRPYSWEYTVALQREVLPRLSVTGMFYRRAWGNIAITDRSLISRADYTAFQVPTPAVTQDPDVAAVVNADQLLTVYNLNAARRSVFGTALVDTNAPDDQSVYTGMEVGFVARFGTAGTIFGNWTLDRNVSVFCTSDDDPNGPAVIDTGGGTAFPNVGNVSYGGRFCDQRRFHIPFHSQFKIAGNFPLKYGIETGVVWQSYPGNERTITYTVPANLFPGGRTNSETIILNEPGSLYLPRWNQVDFNVRKRVKIGGHQLTGEFGLYNALNSAVILSTINTVGASLGRVQTTLNGRTPRIGLQYKF